MAETTGITWTRSTFNPWMGCTKVSPGCDNCYASVSTPVRTMAIGWGPGQPRRRTSASNWGKVETWNKQAPTSEFAGRKGFWPVFTASLADVFDNEVPEEWRADFWALVKRCPNLTFLIVTKRIGNVPKMLPPDWGYGYPNVWLIITVVNQPEADRDIPKLLKIHARVRGLSVEPQLGEIGLDCWPESGCSRNWLDDYGGLDWVICGGESKQGGAEAREFQLEWALSLARETAAAGVAFFMKQAGHTPTLGGAGPRVQLNLTGKGEHPHEWPHELQRREFPEVPA